MKYKGILLPVASLPSQFGIGDLGPTAYQFIDWLKAKGYNLWQVLPLNPLGFGNSPYQPYSSFAGDEIYISPQLLLEEQLLTQAQIADFEPEATVINYTGARLHKQQMLELAYVNFKQRLELNSAYQDFVRETSWAYNYAVFITFKKINQQLPWNLWPVDQKNWINDQAYPLTNLTEQINYELFVQFLFFRQWLRLKNYANSLGIVIMGDIPIYLGYDSLDVWQNQDLFLLDKEGNPSFVAGVPPDYFSATGQRWGNPLYAWDKLEQTNFKFWVERLRGNQQMFDIIRIDHFRAFDTYWKIPASCDTAIEGEWVEAPGYKLFAVLYRELPGIQIVVEDLGDLRPEVLELRDYYNLPGMQVFQFVFNPKGNNLSLQSRENTVIYSGTHDNSTLVGWYKSCSRYQRKLLKRYFKANERNIYHKMLKYLFKCKANYIIVAMQDILGLDDRARINYPGKIGSPNWEWKMQCLPNI